MTGVTFALWLFATVPFIGHAERDASGNAHVFCNFACTVSVDGEPAFIARTAVDVTVPLPAGGVVTIRAAI